MLHVKSIFNFTLSPFEEIISEFLSYCPFFFKSILIFNASACHTWNCPPASPHLWSRDCCG